MRSASFLLSLCLCCTLSSALQTNSRIVGGTEAQPHSYPYQVSIKANGFHSCSGAISDEGHVITAAHCCFTYEASDLRVVAGEHDLLASEDTEQASSVYEMIIHEDFDEFNLFNDICLLILSQEFDFSEIPEVQPVTFPVAEQEFTGLAKVAGWGYTSSDGTGPASSVLREAIMDLITDEDCRSIYGAEAVLDTMLCTHTSGKDTCTLDGGGPLTCSSQSAEGLYCGIVSWGLGCSGMFPTVYTQLSKYIQWLNDNTD